MHWIPRAAALVALVASPVVAQVLTNGSFEQNGGLGHLSPPGPGATGWSSGNPAGTGLPAYNFVADGSADSTGFPSAFNLVGAPNLRVWGPANGINNGFSASPDGGAFLAMSGGYLEAPVFQAIPGLVQGNTYRLSFHYAGSQLTDDYATGSQLPDEAVPTDQSIRVSLGGITLQTPLIQVASKGFSGWQVFEGYFAVTSPQDGLSFRTQNSGRGSLTLIDGVSLANVTPVPEPGTCAVACGIGLLGLASWRRVNRGR